MKVFSRASAKKETKALRVSNFAFFLAIFKWHHGCEGVNILFVSSSYSLENFPPFVEHGWSQKSYYDWRNNNDNKTEDDDDDDDDDGGGGGGGGGGDDDDDDRNEILVKHDPRIIV